jgi:hypothetical protein
MLVLPAAASAQLPSLPVPGLPGLPGPLGSTGPGAQPYGTGDGGGFSNILPPGENGFANGQQLAAFLPSCPPPKTNCPNASRPPHSSDQLGMYGDLVYQAPHLKAADIGKYYKDATFGVKNGDAERVYSPRADVTLTTRSPRTTRKRSKAPETWRQSSKAQTRSPPNPRAHASAAANPRSPTFTSLSSSSSPVSPATAAIE